MLWPEEDQDKALAFYRARSEICRECGTREADWAEDKLAFMSNTKRCYGCEAIETEQANIPEHTKGVKVYLEPRAVAEARDEADDGIS